jgi:alpha-1,6-mannosyltransferase
MYYNLKLEAKMISSLLVPVETTLLLSVAALYIVNCPFNKVEESFNTQAVHDIINIFPSNIPSISSKNLSSHEIAIRSHLPWDHTQNPGPIPRTFIGALMVGLPLRFAKQLILNGFMQDEISVKDDHDFTAQFILQIGSRFALSSFVVISIGVLLKAIQRRYGIAYRLCFLIITVSQFHYMFYAGRFLPNTYAAIFANLVFGSWISRQYSKSIMYIALCVVIFRSDTAVFFGWLLIDGIFIRRFLSLKRVLSIGVPAGLVAIIVSLCVDSFFWGRLVWPELELLHFNVWLNKSQQWGTQPYFWYIYSCIPRIMLASAPLLMLADHKFTRDYLIPSLAFIFTYSILPHKELRFILFITPLLNLCAASGLMNVYYYLNVLFLKLEARIKRQSSKPSSSPLKRKTAPASTGTRDDKRRSVIAVALFTLVIVGMFIANLFACFILARISSHNYPGGQAAISLGVTKELLDAAKQSMDDTTGLRDFRSDVGVYVNNLAAQTGLSRFVQVDGVYYAKTPKLDDQTFKNSYKLIYAILEPKEITEFLVEYCPSNKVGESEMNPESWRRTNEEIKCRIPNQQEMNCSMIDTIESFYSVNIGGLLRKLRQVNSIKSISSVFDDNGFIRTRVALHIIKCSARGQLNKSS